MWIQSLTFSTTSTFSFQVGKCVSWIAMLCFFFLFFFPLSKTHLNCCSFPFIFPLSLPSRWHWRFCMVTEAITACSFYLTLAPISTLLCTRREAMGWKTAWSHFEDELQQPTMPLLCRLYSCFCGFSASFLFIPWMRTFTYFFFFFL